MVQLLHQSNQNTRDPASLCSGDNFSNRQSRDVRARVARALHNTVHIHPSDKHYKKEGKVLKLLENLRMYADVLRDLTLSLKEGDKENCDLSRENKNTEEEGLSGDNTYSKTPEHTTSENKVSEATVITNQEKESAKQVSEICYL